MTSPPLSSFALVLGGALLGSLLTISFTRRNRRRVVLDARNAPNQPGFPYNKAQISGDLVFISGQGKSKIVIFFFNVELLMRRNIQYFSRSTALRAGEREARTQGRNATMPAES